jgi:hypothetical protein
VHDSDSNQGDDANEDDQAEAMNGGEHIMSDEEQDLPPPNLEPQQDFIEAEDNGMPAPEDSDSHQGDDESSQDEPEDEDAAMAEAEAMAWAGWDIDLLSMI